MGGGQGPHLHEQDFGRTIRGDRWGSPAPDKGHDRLAARCTVDSHALCGPPSLEVRPARVLALGKVLRGKGKALCRVRLNSG